MPLILLVFFSVVPAVDQGGVTFLVPGILALAIVSTSLVNLGISTAFERAYGVLKRLGGSPLPRSGLVTAKIVTVVVVEIGQAILLLAVATLGLGWAPGPGANLAVCVAAGSVRDAGLRRARPAPGRHAPGRGDAGDRQRPVPGADPARRASCCRSTTCPPRWPTSPGSCPPRPCPTRSGSAWGRPTGDPVPPLALLAGWAVVTTGLTARTFRWE